LYDGWVIPNKTRMGVADTVLLEIEENSQYIDRFLNSEDIAESHYDGGFLGSGWDDSPLDQQNAAAQHAIALMAKNYLMLARLKGDAEGLDEIRLMSGCCSDEGALGYDGVSLDADREGRTNAQLVSRLLDQAYDSRSEMAAAVYIADAVRDDH
ncbi:MAG: hypothetical protein AAGM67_01375, partial [Bacteroidota bacterium]